MSSSLSMHRRAAPRELPGAGTDGSCATRRSLNILVGHLPCAGTFVKTPYILCYICYIVYITSNRRCIPSILHEYYYLMLENSKQKYSCRHEQTLACAAACNAGALRMPRCLPSFGGVDNAPCQFYRRT